MEDGDLKQVLMTLIGNNVRRYRMERGYTQEELANMVNVDRSTIGRIEGGSRMMSILNLHTVTIEQRKGLKGLSIEVLGHYFI